MSSRFWFLLLCASVGVLSCATNAPAQSGHQNLPAPQTAVRRSSTIPPGTILPVVLQTTISDHAKPGQIVHTQIAQDVPLPDRSKIRKGSKVQGQVVAAVPATANTPGTISLRFDKLSWQGQLVPITTDLRAIAGFMEVLQASVPNQAIGEGDVAQWMTTTQIGGDSVFGIGGPVTSAHNATEIIGKSPMSGGVLVQVRANPSGRCRGPINDNNNLQALWVFSSDACGAYGLAQVSISHAGRTDPVGTAILDVTTPKASIKRGAGLLLRVIS